MEELLSKRLHPPNESDEGGRGGSHASRAFSFAPMGRGTRLSQNDDYTAPPYVKAIIHRPALAASAAVASNVNESHRHQRASSHSHLPTRQRWRRRILSRSTGSSSETKHTPVITSQSICTPPLTSSSAPAVFFGGAALEAPLDLVPPLRFARVEEGVYRGAYPTLRSFPFLETLHLRTIISVSPEEPTYDLKSFAEAHKIALHHIQAERYKGEAQLLPNDLTAAVQTLINVNKHPVYVHCLDGRHVTGLVIMALRKLQKWDVQASHLEYCRFTKEANDEVAFIADFNGPVTLPWKLPAFLWGGTWRDDSGATKRLQTGIRVKFPTGLQPCEGEHQKSSVRDGVLQGELSLAQAVTGLKGAPIETVPRPYRSDPALPHVTANNVAGRFVSASSVVTTALPFEVPGAESTSCGIFLNMNTIPTVNAKQEAAGGTRGLAPNHRKEDFGGSGDGDGRTAPSKVGKKPSQLDFPTVIAEPVVSPLGGNTFTSTSTPRHPVISSTGATGSGVATSSSGATIRSSGTASSLQAANTHSGSNHTSVSLACGTNGNVGINQVGLHIENNVASATDTLVNGKSQVLPIKASPGRRLKRRNSL